MFKSEDIAEYYDTTQIHYKQWWGLKKNRSLHYGIWENGIKNFHQASENTNNILMQNAEIKDKDVILDAGCGVGGAAIYISKRKKVKVTGITLSPSQVNFARSIVKEEGLQDAISIEQMDYTQTAFDDATFDVVWACESVSSCPDKSLFIKEAFRVLKPGGKLVLSDCFLTDANQKDPNNWITKWGATWAVSGLNTSTEFAELLNKQGFSSHKTTNYTQEVYKSARKMYIASLLATIPSETYKIFNPKVSRFARNHYKCGYYQYKALQENLWQYEVICATK